MIEIEVYKYGAGPINTSAKEDTASYGRCLPEGRKCAVALSFKITQLILSVPLSGSTVS